MLTISRAVSVTTNEHRAAWDATISAPKSVSLAALVGWPYQRRPPREHQGEVQSLSRVTRRSPGERILAPRNNTIRKV